MITIEYKESRRPRSSSDPRDDSQWSMMDACQMITSQSPFYQLDMQRDSGISEFIFKFY